MLTLLISLVLGIIISWLCKDLAGISMGWSMTWGILCMIIFQLLSGLYIRKKIMLITADIQNLLMEGSKRINRKVQNLQQKAAGNIKFLQKAVEKDQNDLILQAVEATKRIEPYCKWNFMLKKQINTMRMQFYFQIGEFQKVDALLPKSLFFEPLSVAIKMTRQYKNNDPTLDKTFTSKIKKFKGDKGSILYALYSWILVQRGDVDAAIKLLSRAKEITGNEVLAQNWENLANGKIKKFSNSGLGEEWYALRLEEPKYNVKHVQSRRAAF